MARAPATADAIQTALAAPSLAVGCHVVLVDGQPVLPPRDAPPHLVDPASGRFRSSLFEFLRWLYNPRSRFTQSAHRTAEIEAETAAQIALLQGRGLRLTHIDTHKHLHMFPAVLRPVLRAARAAGIRAVRNPFEPPWSLRATQRAPWLRRAEVSLLHRLEPAFLRIVAEEGFATTGGAIGVLATGTLDAPTLNSLLQQVPQGTWELVVHPGYNDADLAHAHTRLLASREVERAALPVLKNFPGIEPITFAAISASSPLLPTS
jgi:chitin disaccharide deacetylase